MSDGTWKKSELIVDLENLLYDELDEYTVDEDLLRTMIRELEKKEGLENELTKVREESERWWKRWQEACEEKATLEALCARAMGWIDNQDFVAMCGTAALIRMILGNRYRTEDAFKK